MRAIIIILTLTPLFNHAQLDSTSHRHTIGLEVLGKVVAFGGIFYEYNFKKPISLGASLGFAEYNKLHTKPMSSIRYSNSVYGTYHFHLRKKNIKPSKKTIFQTGVTFLHDTELNTKPLNVGTTTTEIFGFVGFGYEYRPKKVFIRIEPYVLFGNDFYFTDGIIPWLGFSFGRMI